MISDEEDHYHVISEFINIIISCSAFVVVVDLLLTCGSHDFAFVCAAEI